MAVVIEIINRAGAVISHQVFTGHEVTVGRSYTNDLVLHDMHVDPFHLRIDCLAETGQFNCADLNSTNGVIDQHKKKIKGVQPIHSGDVLTLGKTLLRISAVDAPVEPAVPLSFWEGVADFLSQWWVVLMLAGLLFSLYVVNAHIEKPMEQNKAVYFQEAFYILIVAVVYGGFYAFIGKIFRHEGRFGLQINLFFSVAIISLLYNLAEPVVLFNLGFNHSVFNLGAVVSALLCFWLIYASLRYATQLRNGVRMLVSLMLPVVILSFAVLETDLFKEADKFVFRPSYDALIMPERWQWQAVQTQQQFLSETQSLYHDTVN